MDEICLRKPPIHLEGEHLLRKRSWKGRTWEPKFFMVLGNTLSICDNSSMVGSSLLDVEFDDIDICDGHIKHSRKKYVIQIQLNNGLKFDGETEIYFAVESKDVFDVWSKGLVYAKYYWLKKSSVPSTIQPLAEDSASNKFLLDLVLYNGVTASISLGPSSVFKDVVKQVNRTGGCYCKICEVSELTAKLFVVNQEGKITKISSEEKIYNYYKDGCKFYLMEKEYRVLVVFFEIGTEKVTFKSFTAKRNLTASELTRINLCREEIPKENNSELAVYYRNDSVDVQLSGTDNVLDFLYDKHGNLLNNTGKIIIRTQEGRARSNTCSIDDGENMKAKAAQMRAKMHVQDDIQKSVKRELDQNAIQRYKNITLASDDEHMIIDSESPSIDIQNIRGQVKTKPVVLSSGQIIHVTDTEGDINESGISEDEENVTFPDQDPDNILHIFGNQNAYEELFLNSAHSSSSELSTTDSVRSSSFNMEEFYRPENPANKEIPHSHRMENSLSVDAAYISDALGITGDAMISKQPSSDIDGVDDAVDDEKGSTSLIMELYSETVLERVGSVGSVDNKEPTDVKNDVEIVLVSEEETTLDVPLNTSNNESDGQDKGQHIDSPPKAEFQHTKENKEVIQKKTPFSHNIVIKKNEDIVVNKKPPKKNGKSKCHICDTLTESDEKPRVIKTNILSFLNKTGQDQYICLIGIHLRKKDGSWSAVDDCEVSTDFSDQEWQDAMESRKSKENLGNFVCLFVQARRGGSWYVRHMQQRLDSLENDPDHHHQDGGDEEEGPIVASTVNVAPDIVKTEKSEHVLDDVDDDDFFEGSLEFDRDPNNYTNKWKKNFTEFKQTLQEKAQTIKTSVPQMAIETKNDMINYSSNDIFPVKEKLKGKLKNAYDIMSDTISQMSMDDRRSTVHMDKEILSDEFIAIDQSYVKPLKDTIFQICSRLESVQLSLQHQHGDDFKTVEIGWEIRRDFCTILANFLSIGLREETKVMMSLFSAPTIVTLWTLVREFSLAFKRQEFSSVIRTIQTSRFLLNDDQRYRFFICELLNRSVDDGSEKLIVLFFQLFPTLSSKLEKYYVPGSFWRMTCQSGLGVILDEVVLSMRHFNGWPFNLHIDFEYRLCPKQHEDSLPNEDNLVFEF